MDSPLVSVVMPVYGVEKYVAAAVRSVLAQTMPRFELIVVDDCGTDDSMAIVAAIDDPRIRIVRHDRNQGLAAARNTGIDEARGEYVALLDADDVSPPHRLATQLAAMSREPALVGCGGWMQYMDPHGALYGQVHRSETAPEKMAATLLLRNAFFVSSMMFRREAMAGEPYRRDYRMAEDYELMVRLARLGPLRNLPEVLLHYRIHAASLTSTKPRLMDECRRRIAADQLQRLGIEPHAAHLDLHMLAAIPSAELSRPQLGAVFDWLRLLSRANHDRPVYAQQPLDDVLAASWFEVCTVASGLGPCALTGYLQRRLPGRADIPPRRLLKFAAKSLLGLRRDALRA